MLKNHLYTILIFILFISFACVKKKVAKYGCRDIEALNYSNDADFDNGNCKYTPVFQAAGFESNDPWVTYVGNNFSPYAVISKINDGFMPTEGQYYFKCIPTVNNSMGTWTKQYIHSTTHTSGFYFDYSCDAIATSSDSLLVVEMSLENTVNTGTQSITTYTLWSKKISESPATFNGFPIIHLQKKSQYVELPLTENNGLFSIKTNVSKGTFTFCIDNIREVQR
jgi:hypothetical protein